MSGYSSIFSSGLLASPRPDRHINRVDYSISPWPDSPINIGSDADTTPTKLSAVSIPSSEEAMNYFMPRSLDSSNASVTTSVLVGVPHLRRRRSSLSIANNGMSTVKSPQRNAGNALQRNTLMGSSGRVRSGSIDAGPADIPPIDEVGHGLVPNKTGGGRGRSRSGSMGGAMRLRRSLRKPPSIPPPTTPLPPLPMSAAVKEAMHRLPLVQTVENFAPFTPTLNPHTNSSMSLTLTSVDLTSNLKIRATMGTTSPSSSSLGESSVFGAFGARMKEN
ncbi:hypothetical protein F5148DRAFT_1378897 [Russula earlei]|uniref:Uncharacterized protein n=1 Tax=Russula earlei TaxID=71964 RepID=A0ACC0TYA2_9AGAM|nr:hypothetical protein F5148DRAFT_1378897 [Russula earlei]